MKKLGVTLIALSALSVAAASAQEQGKSDWDKIVLEDKAGNVMTSTGGDYQTAQVGKELIIGEHMMLGDATKARERLGWVPKITFEEMVAEMVREDLKLAERDELVKRHGYQTFNFNE